MIRFMMVLTVACLCARMSFADEWQNLAKYKYGEGKAAEEAAALLRKTPVAQHGAIEDSLIAVVSSKEATQDGKALACRMLQQIATEKSIPAVADLLNDEVLSHYARLVLERIGSAKADEAMRTALGNAPDKAKIGIIGSLGVRRDNKAVQQIVAFVGHTDPTVASAAISALGRIGGNSAAACLSKLKPAKHLKSVHLTALLDCARSLQGSEAVSLYELVLASKTSHRIGALSGMLAADEKKAAALMVGFINGDDVKICRGVLTLICGAKSEYLTQAMAELLSGLPDKKKTALITALGTRGDKAALGAISACLVSTNESVHNAAIMAVSKLGDKATVKVLLGMSGGSTDAIAKMPDRGVDDALIKALDDHKFKVPAIKALVARNCTAAVPVLFNLLNDGDLEVRRLAWGGLDSLANGDDITRMAKVAFAIKDEGELACAVSATMHVCAYAGDKAKCFGVIASYYDGVTDASKSAIVDLASRIGSPSAMEVVKKAMKSGNKEFYGMAVRSLAAWCNESAVGDLLELAKGAPEEVERILALRGYIRLAGEGPNLNEEQRAEIFKKASELAKRTDEKKLLAGYLRRAPNAVALAIANLYMDDPAVRREVEQSAVDIAEHLHAEKKGPANVIKEVANKLLTSKDGRVVDRAKRLLTNMSK